MKYLILFLFLFSPVLNAKSITTSDILQSFDLCSMKSSFGQLCKLDNPNKTFYEFMIDNESSLHGANFDAGENFVIVESDDWFYKIDIISSEDNKAILEFTDDSKTGSYYAHSQLEVIYNNDTQKWIVTTDKEISLSEDAKLKFSYLDLDDHFMNKYVDLMLSFFQTGQVNEIAKKRLWQNNTNEDHIKFAEWMSAFVLQAYSVQVENVNSAKLSLKNKKVTYSDNYFIEVEKSSKFLETMPLDPDSSLYKDFMQGFFDQMAHTDKNTKSFLLSAATQEPMQESMSGVSMIVDQQMINQLENNLYFLKVLSDEVLNPIY